MTASIPERPVLVTDRLRLRAHERGDLAPAAAMWADPAIIRHIGGKAFSREEVWSRILRYAGLWALLGYGYWAIEERSSGDFVGEIGLADFERDLDPSPGALPELGYAIAPAAQGRGYATEAVRTVLAWADAHLPDPASCCLIDPDNLPSRRVAEKCGYREWLATRYRGRPSQLWRRVARGG